MQLVFCAIAGLLLLFALSLSAAAQKVCGGEQLFNEKNCSGDEVSKDEQLLLNIINQYRKENNLPEVGISKHLSLVANRHLIDLQTNLKFLTHSWSNCPYDIKNRETWKCVTDAPKKFDKTFKGDGFENLYRNLNGNASPASALEGWKKSPLHNSLILNLDNWKQFKWDAVGVGIRGEYAALWFGTKDANEVFEDYKTPEGLNLTFEEVARNLTTVVSIQKTSTVLENEKWVGASKDKSVILEMFGKQKDISEAALRLRVKLDEQNNLSRRNNNLILIYLQNIFSNSGEPADWFETNFPKLVQKTNFSINFIKNGKILEITIDRNNYLVLNVKPYKKTNGARQIE